MQSHPTKTKSCFGSVLDFSINVLSLFVGLVMGIGQHVCPLKELSPQTLYAISQPSGAGQGISQGWTSESGDRPYTRGSPPGRSSTAAWHSIPWNYDDGNSCTETEASSQATCLPPRPLGGARIVTHPHVLEIARPGATIHFKARRIAGHAIWTWPRILGRGGGLAGDLYAGHPLTGLRKTMVDPNRLYVHGRWNC